MPRLARAGWFAPIRRLRNVREKNGFIHGVWPTAEDPTAYWEPLRDYYVAGKQPYLAFARCHADAGSIIHFVQKFGVPLDDTSQASGETIVFPLNDFNLERWVLSLSVMLVATLKRAEGLRSVFDTHLREASKRTQMGQRGWQQRIVGIYQAMPGASLPSDTTSPKEFTAAVLKDLGARLKEATPPEIETAARSYISGIVNSRIVQVIPHFDLYADDGPALYAYCPSLLHQFYWMFATDVQGRRSQLACASCGGLFFSQNVNARYCRRPTCREHGRRKLDWARNKDTYNENRRVKRRKLRELRRTKSKQNR